MKKAIISGITGQDGSYLAELLLASNYEVHGIARRSHQLNPSTGRHLHDPGGNLHIHYADLGDDNSLHRIIHRIQPDEFYHLAGHSHVGLSFQTPHSTVTEIANATLSLLEICRDLDSPPRIFHASTSEIFGIPKDYPQTENTPYRPVNPYGCAKAFATNLCAVYRDTHGLYVVNGILYNHESPRRGESFVTKKIVAAAARIVNGSKEILELGNLDSQRDWGWAPEFVDAIRSTLQMDHASDYLISTGTSTTVRDFALAAFHEAGIQLVFSGSGIDEQAHCAQTGRLLLKVNPQFFRPVDSHRLIGDPSKARKALNWSPILSGVHVAAALTRYEINSFANINHSQSSD